MSAIMIKVFLIMSIVISFTVATIDFLPSITNIVRYDIDWWNAPYKKEVEE